MFFMFFGAYYALQIISYVFEVMRLVDMYRFYTYLLGIPDVRPLVLADLTYLSRSVSPGRYSNDFVARDRPSDRSHT